MHITIRVGTNTEKILQIQIHLFFLTANINADDSQSVPANVQAKIASEMPVPHSLGK